MSGECQMETDQHLIEQDIGVYHRYDVQVFTPRHCTDWVSQPALSTSRTVSTTVDHPVQCPQTNLSPENLTRDQPYRPPLVGYTVSPTQLLSPLHNLPRPRTARHNVSLAVDSPHTAKLPALSPSPFRYDLLLCFS